MEGRSPLSYMDERPIHQETYEISELALSSNELAFLSNNSVLNRKVQIQIIRIYLWNEETKTLACLKIINKNQITRKFKVCNRFWMYNDTWRSTTTTSFSTIHQTYKGR